MADNKFGCDYAKRGTSSCKKCKQKLEKGGLRMAKLVYNPFTDNEGDMMKQYFHAKCLFETFVRARASTKIIEGLDDIEESNILTQEDKDMLNELIRDLMAKKGASPKKKATPAKKKADPSPQAAAAGGTQMAGPSKTSPQSTTAEPAAPDNPDHPDNSFRQFRRLCADIAEENSSNGKRDIVHKFLRKGSSGDGFQGDTYLLVKFLLPGIDKTVYNLKSKQLAKLFSQIFGLSLEEMVEDLEQGDVAETVKAFFEKCSVIEPLKKSVLTLHAVDTYLAELSRYTRDEDQQRLLTKVAKRCTSNDLKMVVRLIKHDLRINAGAKPILDALDPNAYEAHKASRDLRDVVDRVQQLKNGATPGMKKELSIKANLMTPVQPMLAEACKSIDFAFKRCPSGMYAELKYDGERVQVHKQGDDFQYFSRSLKPVQAHKVSHFKEFIPKAFQQGRDIILDAEVLLIDTKTGNPLPFGTLGVHKKAAFQDAQVCLFIFDCMHYNGESLMNKPIKERRKVLREVMTEIPNRIMFSDMKHITEPEDLRDLMMKVFREGLEGLVLKDLNGVYEPGKRHWMKVKKDYLAEGAMADSADLVVVGANFGTGSKGGIMSVFLMGVYNPALDKWCTVTKCHCGFDDKTLEKLQKQLDMVKISKDYDKVPSWLKLNRNLVPDFVAADPKKAPVFEITGAEFTKSDVHTADGISIRFPRCTKIRDDKSWAEATDLPRLQLLYKKSKEYSDLPDFLSAAKSRFKKKSPAAAASAAGADTLAGKLKTEAEEGSSSAASSPNATPQKRKLERGEVEDGDGPAIKKEKREESRPACKYGAACYQQQPDHRKKFAHPTNNKTLPDVFSGMKFHVPNGVREQQEMIRYIIAFDGDVVADHDKSTATHIVSESARSHSDQKAAAKLVTSKWVWRCIKKKTLVPMTTKS